MTSDDEKKVFDEVRNVERAMVARIAELPQDDLLAEMREDGIDLKDDADRVRQLLARSIGKARMAAARAGLAASRSQRHTQKDVNVDPSSNVLREAQGLTMAARNGTEQTEADIASVANDFAELDEPEAGKPKE
jgi:hypothetical protein